MLRVACWNIRSWSKRDQEVILEINNHQIDICSLSETRRKGKGTTKYNNYLLVYSGKENSSKMSNSGVGIVIHERFEPQITEVKYINDRILIVTLKMESKKLHIIAVYTPDADKPLEGNKSFCQKAQNQIDVIPTKERILFMGDMNARIGNDVIEGVKERFNKDVTNDRGKIMTEFCAHNELRINNTFFQHKDQYKYTWSDTRGRKSIIDYVLTNRTFHSKSILNVRVLLTANIYSDHVLLLCNIRIYRPPKIKYNTEYIQKINVESLENANTRNLNKTRLERKKEENNINKSDTVKESWNKLAKNILTASEEALGQRQVNQNNKRYKKPWFHEEVCCEGFRLFFCAFRP
ncbi:hypothetical protein M0802_009992 [Mischocyttarus mexicanus]|nr:hypothetical protein M0802_009992 [Mischocyttarus mexicanus]